jgi:hypothetical protein
MKDYKEEMERLGIEENRYPYYDNPENFAARFKRCPLYEYGDISYSDTSIEITEKPKSTSALLYINIV